MSSNDTMIEKLDPLPQLPKVSQKDWWPQWVPLANDSQKANIVGLRAWDIPCNNPATAQELADRRHIFKWLYDSVSQELNVLWMLDWVGWNPEDSDPYHLYTKVFQAFEFDSPSQVTATHFDQTPRGAEDDELGYETDYDASLEHHTGPVQSRQGTVEDVEDEADVAMKE
ncbi:hypothetical protein B0T21DRAFT_454323 [Apiosordaria backusii]|uniref:Uncharacterized protein n=1 Tax=Apiosordaria backusii TaxID=314023 RepID=A0AA40AIM0_9PEZI|nr:hypothetical protein B0T21DRAFT_454323 [Apiosordaria backusii]